jgi:hypothetical protein
MKKYVVGFLAGVLLTFSMSAYADDIKNLVGQKVQGTVAVKVNGAQVADGVIIKGTSYAPVRSLTEAAGLDVSYDKGVVTVVNGIKITLTADQIKTQLVSLNELKDYYLSQIGKYETLLNDDKYKNEWSSYQELLNGVKQKLDECQVSIDKAESQLAELEAQ